MNGRPDIETRIKKCTACTVQDCEWASHHYREISSTCCREDRDRKECAICSIPYHQELSRQSARPRAFLNIQPYVVLLLQAPETLHLHSLRAVARNLACSRNLESWLNQNKTERVDSLGFFLSLVTSALQEGKSSHSSGNSQGDSIDESPFPRGDELSPGMWQRKFLRDQKINGCDRQIYKNLETRTLQRDSIIP